MEIINIEKLDKHKIIVLTGRDEHVRKVAKNLKAILYYCPRDSDYFMDYPKIVDELKNTLAYYYERTVIITTQSAEFLDCLLESDINFILVTIRKFDRDDSETYRLRVHDKDEALKLRYDYNMELRV